MARAPQLPGSDGGKCSVVPKSRLLRLLCSRRLERLALHLHHLCLRHLWYRLAYGWPSMVGEERLDNVVWVVLFHTVCGI